MTEPVFNAIKAWTGDRPLSCPWAPFFDPYVQRVQRAHRAFAEGQMQLVEPSPSHRVMMGVLHFDHALKAVEHHQFKQEQAAREQARGAKP